MTDPKEKPKKKAAKKKKEMASVDFVNTFVSREIEGLRIETRERFISYRALTRDIKSLTKRMAALEKFVSRHEAKMDMNVKPLIRESAGRAI